MSQHEILEHLEKNSDKWFTTLDLLPIVNANTHSVTRAINKLYQYGFLDKEIRTKKTKNNVYHIRYYKSKKK